MDYTEYYAKTKEFMKGRWWDIFFIRLIYGVLTFLLMSILVTYVFDPKWFSSLMYVTHIDLSSLKNFFISASASSAISSVIVGVVNGALTMTILQAYQNNSSVRFFDVYKTLKRNVVKLFIVLLLLAVVQFVITIIPYVNWFSFILLPFINYVTLFTFFILSDRPGDGSVSAIKSSVLKTRGHKYHLFRITLHYFFRKFVGYGFVFLGFVFVTVGLILSEGSVSSSIFMMLGLAKISLGIGVNIFMAIKFGPYATVAHAIYYESLKKEQKLS